MRDQVADPRDASVPVERRNCRTDPVDMANGAVVLSQTDVALPGVLPLVLRRTHVSSYRAGRWFGRSWASTLDQRAEVDSAGVCVSTDDGMVLAYPAPPAVGEVLPVEGPRWPLCRDGDGFRVTDPWRGLSWRFAPPAGAGGGTALAGGGVGVDSRVLPLVAIVDRGGDRIDVVYGLDGSVKEIRHGGGYRVGVDTAGGRITALRLRPRTDAGAPGIPSPGVPSPGEAPFLKWRS